MRKSALVSMAALLAVMPAPEAPADEAIVSKQGSLDVAVGRALFERGWVPAPASTSRTDGLGPLFNARSCAECHRAGGRGELALDADGWTRGAGFVVRLGDSEGRPDPVYGHQIQTRAVAGLAPEARVRISWRTHVERFADGRQVRLRKPEVELSELGYGPLAPTTNVSLRLAPDLRAAARIAAVDRDPAPSRDGGEDLRFGRKATGASLAGQTADAFSLDLGLSTRAMPGAAGDCTKQQVSCLAQPQGAAAGEAELPDAVVQNVVTYLASLDQEERSDDFPRWPAIAGADAFAAAGCPACHVPQAPGRRGRPVSVYSDLKLHDLGEDLADPVGTPGRKATEWRTQSLVGIGAALAEGRPLLHDGRAQSIGEAILWHGGEAAAARERYLHMDADERRALEDFVATR